MCGKQRTCAGLLADGPVLSRKRSAQMRWDYIDRILYDLYIKVGIPAVSSWKLTRGRGQPAPNPFVPRVPALEGVKMLNSQGLRKFSLAVAAAAFFTVAGCSNQATDQATKQTPASAKRAAAAKAAAAKPAAAKPATKKAEPAKVVAAKSGTAKPVAASSKVTQPTTLVTVPKGTAISATVGEALASNKNHAGDTFAAILSSSIKVNGKTVIPKGTHITGRVVTAQKKGPAELTVALASVDLNGKSYKLVTDTINPSGKSPAKTDAADSDAKAKDTKDVTVAAEHRLKFRLAKSVKLPVKS